jgi:hypothetical protein
MRKAEAAWLSIRLIGFGFALYSINCILLFVYNLLLAALSITYSDDIIVELLKLRWDLALEAFLSTCIALYFLTGGRVVYKWLMRECT